MEDDFGSTEGNFSIFLTFSGQDDTIMKIKKTGCLCKQAESKLYCFNP